MTIGDYIKEYRLNHNYSMDEFARRSGLSKAYVSILERNYNPSTKRAAIPSLDTIKRVSLATGMDFNDLLAILDSDQKVSLNPEGNDSFPFPPNAFPLPRMKEWRVLGGTACGTPLYKELDNETVLAPADIDADYVFRCVGDSMINARIFDGDIVFVKSGVTVEDGQIAVVRIGEEYTLKRIYHGPDYLELRSENPLPEYKPIFVRGEQENAEIVGLAVKFLSNVI